MRVRNNRYDDKPRGIERIRRRSIYEGSPYDYDRKNVYDIHKQMLRENLQKNENNKHVYFDSGVYKYIILPLLRLISGSCVLMTFLFVLDKFYLYEQLILIFAAYHVIGIVLIYIYNANQIDDFIKNNKDILLYVFNYLLSIFFIIAG